jgi:hypothetical protein
VCDSVVEIPVLHLSRNSPTERGPLLQKIGPNERLLRFRFGRSLSGREKRSIPIFSRRNQKAWLTPTGPIGSAVSTRYSPTRCNRSHGYDARLTSETTTTRSLCGTRTGTNCAAIVSMNGCLSKFATMPINIGRNLAPLLSEDLLGCWPLG